MAYRIAVEIWALYKSEIVLISWRWETIFGLYCFGSKHQDSGKKNWSYKKQVKILVNQRNWVVFRLYYLWQKVYQKLK